MDNEFNLLLYFLIWSIYIIFIFSLLLVFADFLRRIRNQIFYKRKDSYRKRFLEIFRDYIKFRDPTLLDNLYQKPPKSLLEMEALYETLTKFPSLSHEEILSISERTGLKKFYLAKLNAKRDYKRVEAYSVLSFIRDRNNFQEIFERVRGERDPEIVFSGIMALCKIISSHTLSQLLSLLEQKYQKNLLNLRAVSSIFIELTNSLLDDILPFLNSYFRSSRLPTLYKAAILDGLYFSKLEGSGLTEFALNLLNDKDPEILARALKIISKTISKETNIKIEDILPFLEHQIWYVRLNALKVIEKLINFDQIDYLIPLLSDENYLIRKESAKIIIDVILERNEEKIISLLKIPDKFAIDSLLDVIIRKYALSKNIKYRQVLECYFLCFLDLKLVDTKKINYGTT